MILQGQIFQSQFILTCSTSTLITFLHECSVSVKSMKLLSHLLTTPSSEDADVTLSDRLYAWDTIKLGLLYTRGWRATVWATWQPDSWLSPHQGDRLQHRPESKLKWIRENIQSRYETISLTNMSCANLHKNQLTRVTVGCQERSDKRNYWWPKFGLANLVSVGLGFESNHND